MSSNPALTVVGTVMQAAAPDRLEVLRDHRITVSGDGVIADMAPDSQYTDQADVVLGADSVLMPGLVDLHVHAPQWPQLGTALDVSLEHWLDRHTFPLEARYADTAFAARVWDHMVPSLLAHGTTTAVYYSSIHIEATLALAEACAQHGQRAFVGRVAMDHPLGTPENYRDRNAAAAVTASAESIDQIRGLRNPLVRPIITPRFVPACTDSLLGGLAELAQATNTTVQTHCSESDWEHQHVLDRYGMSDTAAFDRMGLLAPGAVMAHAVHVSDADLALIEHRRAGIAHCPLSNAYFGDGVFPLRRAMASGARVGLGSDIAGGADPGLLSQAAMAVTASRMLEAGVDPEVATQHRGRPDARVDAVTAFWLATVGGADVLGLPIGRLEPGRSFDAIAIGGDEDSLLRRWPELDTGDADEDDHRRFEKIVRLGGASDISHVWVAGRRTAAGS